MSMQEIKRVEEVIQSEELTSDISSLTETENKRIASGGWDGNIFISSYDVNKRTWKVDILKEKAHNKWVSFLCIFNGNRLLSCSWDKSIKLWTISDINITLIKEIEGHIKWVNRVIPLTNERFASCSNDYAVRIWKDDYTYECISTLKHAQISPNVK